MSVGVICSDRWVLSDSHKSYFKDWCHLMNSQPTFLFLTQWIMTILSKGCKPDNFEPHNSLKLSFTNIQHLCSNFVECEYFLELNSPDILALCESNLDDLIDSGNFLVRRYLPLIQNNSIAHMMVLQFMWRKDFFFAQVLFLENSEDSYLHFWLALLHSVLLLFPLLIIFFVIMHSFWFYFI